MLREKTISIIIPFYNEEKGICSFLAKQLFPILEEIDYQTELVFVDDGSSDGTLEKVKTLVKPLKNKIKIISFSRNFGKEAALASGLFYASGDAAIMIDSDGQHPPHAILEMLEKWEKGAEVVLAVRNQNGTAHKFGSMLFYKILRLMGQKNVLAGTMDFRLIDRVVIDEYNKFTEHSRMSRGLIDWLGFKRDYIKVNINTRTEGKPTYSFKKLAGLAIDSFVSLSRTPLVIFGYIGIFITATSSVLGLFILIQQYILGDPMRLDWSGAVLMSVFVSFLVGLVLISQSITALYISQIHIETKNRPLYIIDRKKSTGIK